MKPTLLTQCLVFCRMLGLDYAALKWDHMHAKALDGPDDRHNPDNWQPLTQAQHDTKTFGRGGEKRITTYGSDIHAIRKADRLEEANAAFARKMAKGLRRHEKPEPSRWPRQKLQSRKRG